VGTGPGTVLGLTTTADSLGYHRLWFTGSRADPLLVAAAVAGATQRIRLGISAVDPARADIDRLGRDLNALDLLSGGRLDISLAWPEAESPGANSGSPGKEVGAGLDALLERLAEHSGAQAGAAGSPAAARPHPPVFVRAPSDQAAEWAGGRHLGILLPAFAPAPVLRRRVERFVRGGGAPSDAIAERFFLVAADDTEAATRTAEISGRLSARMHQSYGSEWALADLAAVDFSSRDWFGGVAFTGGPATVAAQIREFAAVTGIEEMALRPSLGGNSPLPVQEETVALFAGHVMNELERAGTTAAHR
jgi:alkanesulfonate monooxygenase SsuD/methylene tetrahydromethanopterin reductase-like flavin-dependent oxidoreductase (luciferase family)